MLISKDTASAILAYGISDKSGKFEIKVSSEADTIILKTSYIGYATKSISIRNISQNIELTLSASSEELKEVIVESRILEQRGDTLSFSVDAFKDQEDRVIADVLKKIPGIEIMPSGQIHYKGEPIRKYYIEGLDLLEGRYNLANENLNAEAVSKVQILENHQPIKVLDSLEFSERASLNIKLKKNVTVTGTAEVGTGFSPLLWQTKLTPMLFTKDRQAIVTYQSNNTGKDLAREIRDFSFNISGNNFDIKKKDFLSIAQLAEPNFSTERWLDNNSHLGSINYLVKLGKELELKTNISYLNDSQKQQGIKRTSFFTPGDTVNLVENTKNEFHINTLQAKFTLEKNSDKKYLKNQLELKGFWDTSSGFITRSESEIDQDLNTPFKGIKNNFQLLNPVGKQLVTFRSNTGYSESNQSLMVIPGQFEEILNQGELYDKNIQHLQNQQFFTDNSAGFTKALGNFTMSPKIGFFLHNEALESQLYYGETVLNEDFINNLDLTDSEFYLDNSIRFESKDETWNLRVGTDLAYKNIQAKMDGDRADRELNRLVFEPDLYLKKRISSYWETSLSAGLNYDFGGIERMYQGYVLSNYRRLQRYDSPISEETNQNYRISLNYRNPLEQTFINSSYRFLHNRSNLLYSSFISENGASLNQAIEKDNLAQTHSFNLSFSQYFNKINTTLKLSGTYNLSDREQMLNQELTEVQNNSFLGEISANSEITDWLSINYDGNFSYYQTFLEERNVQKLRSGSHFLNAYFYLSDQQFLSAGGEYYTNSISENANNYFLNLEYQYSFQKPKIDLSLSWNNILNTDEFVNISSSEYTYMETSYKLRPSQVLASIKFSF